MNSGIIFSCITSRGKNINVELKVCTPCILRIKMYPEVEKRDVASLLEIKRDWDISAFDVSETPDKVMVKTEVLRFEVQKEPWQYSIYDKNSKVILKEHIADLDVHNNYRSLPVGFTTENGRFLRANETFYISPGECFYGFGEKFTRLNKLGQRICGWNTNPFGVGTEESYKNIPFFVSTRGYGVFINSTHRITYEMGSRSLMSYTIMIEEPRLDLFLIYGPELKDVLAHYAEITGYPSLPPLESFGLWYTPFSWSDDIDYYVGLARKFRELDIPIDQFSCIVNLTSFPGRPELTMKELVKRTKALSSALSKESIKIGLYVAPLLNIGTELEKEAREHGYCLKREDGSAYEIPLGVKNNGEIRETEYSMAMLERDHAWRERHNRIVYTSCLMPDFTNPEAFKWWKSKIIELMKAGCFGIDMSDFGEDVPSDAYYYSGRVGKEMHNVYPLLYQKASYEAVAEGTGHRGLVNARSGTAGLQRYPICWSGDSSCTWEDMLATIRGGLSIGLSGVAFWSCDTGGYVPLTSELTPELWIRWAQFAMFLSHTRLHGIGPERVPWNFGEKALNIFRRYARLRYRLLPYIFSSAYKSTQTGLPMIRAMVLEFQDDPNTYDRDDQYMFGDAFLVAPVYTPENKRTVYLPKGIWFNYWTGEEYQGAKTLYIQPPLEELPLYIRCNSIVPIGPDIDYIGQKPFDPLTLDIWLCDSARFTIYDEEEMVECKAECRGRRKVVEVSNSKKHYFVKLNHTVCPIQVIFNEQNLPRFDSIGEIKRAEFGWYFETPSTVWIKFNGSGRNNKIIIEE
ncbi:DUF4968 domain-containing protein [Candidatus Sumerlaeota bacterium]|nr:DUF4968 domain-containing protein [Candidatus Sumerlaeota bacterium]